MVANLNRIVVGVRYRFLVLLLVVQRVDPSYFLWWRNLALAVGGAITVRVFEVPLVASGYLVVWALVRDLSLFEGLRHPYPSLLSLILLQLIDHRKQLGWIQSPMVCLKRMDHSPDKYLVLGLALNLYFVRNSSCFRKGYFEIQVQFSSLHHASRSVGSKIH